MKLLKYLLLSLSMLCATFVSAITVIQPQTVSFAWDASPVPGTSYVVYYGTNVGVYTKSFNVGTNTQCTLSNLVVGKTNYVAVAAVSGSGANSALSKSIVISAPTANFTYVTKSPIGGPTYVWAFIPAGSHYTIYQNANLLTTNWVAVYTNTATNGIMVYTDTYNPSIPAVFYRFSIP